MNATTEGNKKIKDLKKEDIENFIETFFSHDAHIKAYNIYKSIYFALKCPKKEESFKIVSSIETKVQSKIENILLIENFSFCRVRERRDHKGILFYPITSN